MMNRRAVMHRPRLAARSRPLFEDPMNRLIRFSVLLLVCLFAGYGRWVSLAISLAVFGFSLLLAGML